tara:strand:- start:504 stop:701 length:198 start_codon:yes stop_codon:yes gene_type:complete
LWSLLFGGKLQMAKNPLYMPIGSVRAILALLLVLAMVCPAINSEAINNAGLIVLGFYFGNRTNKN